MSKIDLKREISAYRARRGNFDVVEVPTIRYLMIDGRGDPNTAPEYAEAVGTLFALSYRLKFASKRLHDRDYVVMPLEALWWSDDMAAFTSGRDKQRWRWTAMMLVPDWIDSGLLDETLATAPRDRVPAIARVRVEELDRGVACRSCTSARTTTRLACSRSFTIASSPHSG